jgi:thiamine-monophosphate kinase
MFPNLGEFNFIQTLLKDAADFKKEPPATRGWLGVGDDCAQFDGWLVTKDLSVENTHFRLDWSTPEQAVEKHIVSNVSDISAMGGISRFAVLGLCINKNWSLETRTRVQAAISQGFARRGIALIGGDTVVGDVGMFSTTLLGSLENETSKPLLRSAVKPGDKLYVNGTLGKSDAGLWLLMNHPEAKEEFPTLVEYHLSPKICERAGAELVRLGASGACMDISDGLSSELNHLALSSGVSLQIDEQKLPIDSEVLRMCEKYGENPLNFALNGGEEYELLFANSSPKSIFMKNTQLGEVCEIGYAAEKAVGAPVSMLCKNGEKVPVHPRAWSHL